MTTSKPISGVHALALSACVGAFTLLSATCLATPALAAGGLEMSTDYTGITAKPGDTLNFSLDFTNQTGAGLNTSLSATGLDDSWKGYFEGNSKEVSNVFVKSGSDADSNDGLVTYSVTVPDDAQKGSYNVLLHAASAGEASSDLQLTINVSDETTGTNQLTTTYPEQQGASGTTFTFNSTVQNNSSGAQTYSLAADAPTGWTVSFKPNGASNAASSVDVDAHGSQSVTVTVTPPDKVAAGDYEIPITATSSAQSLSQTLKVTITGTYKIDLTTTDGTLSFNANVNKKQSVPITVTNSGNIDLNNVNLTTTAPTGWTVEFSESTIDTLPAGEKKDVVMYVTPSKDAMSGDYAMTVSAQNEDTSLDQSFRVTVKTSTLWGVVGILIIAAVICGLGEVFHKYGRH